MRWVTNLFSSPQANCRAGARRSHGIGNSGWGGGNAVWGIPSTFARARFHRYSGAISVNCSWRVAKKRPPLGVTNKSSSSPI